jgi:chaperonin GroES
MPMMTKVGDRVIYGEYAGAEIVVEGEKYIIVEENKILLIL